ncbi:MAG: iron-sulfur cluster assembly scaffold protein [Pseudomonadota bacterium]|nr:iron-sulfur cluster assembly scaffold protein [Pseudomonadota bacterium]
MSYNELTRRYFEAPTHVGELSGPGVFRGEAGTREQGVWVRFDLQAGTGTLLTARFLAFGCPHTIAIASWLTSHAAGKPLEGALPESIADLRVRFALPVEKMGRLLIIEDAWLAAATAAIDYLRWVPISG